MTAACFGWRLRKRGRQASAPLFHASSTSYAVHRAVRGGRAATRETRWRALRTARQRRAAGDLRYARWAAGVQAQRCGIIRQLVGSSLVAA